MERKENFMGIVFDVILIAICIINIYVGYKKGLVKVGVGLIAVLASVIIALALYKPVSKMVIENTEFDDKIENAIIENFTTENSNSQEDDEDGGFTKYIEKYVDNSVNKTKNEIVIEASTVISEKVINVVVIIGIFILCRLLLIVLTFITDIITSLPIIKQFNKAGGIAYGVIKSLLIIYVILAILFIIVYTTGNATISDAISGSYITKIFYNNNLLLNILFK